MAISNSKRHLLRGRISASMPFRPPWAIDEEAFINTCTRCGECVNQCPQKVIQKGDGGFPEINFSKSGCDFCQLCVEVCPTRALQIQHDDAFNTLVTINQDCFSERGIVCRSCGEVCESRAISFRQVVGGITHVLMDPSSCNGCGECISLCPANAITLKHQGDNNNSFSSHKISIGR